MLVVVDYEAARDAVARALYRAGYVPCVAKDADDAIAKVGLCRHDAAIVDDVLRTVEDTERVMAALRTRAVPVVALVLDGKRKAMLAAGARELLGRPFRAEALIAALERALEEPPHAE